jgi:hypothetical protein
VIRRLHPHQAGAPGHRVQLEQIGQRRDRDRAAERRGRRTLELGHLVEQRAERERLREKMVRPSARPDGHVVRGERRDLDRRRRPPELLDLRDELDTGQAGHPHVGDQDGGLLLLHPGQRLVRVARPLDAALAELGLEHPDQRLGQLDFVVDQDDRSGAGGWGTG